MAEESEERSELEAKLELPTLGLRRRRRGKKAEAPQPVEQPEPEPAKEPEPEPVAVEPEPPAPEPEPEPQPVWARELVVRQAASLPTAAAAARAAEAPARSAPEPVAAEPEPRPETPPEPQPLVDEPPAHVEPAAARRRRRPRLPSVHLPTVHASGRVAAVVTGVVVGLTGVLLVYLSEQGCAAVRNTTSCGGAGVVLLIAIFALMVLEGSALLRAFVVPEPLSTAFLGVGLVAVLTMLFLLGVADRWYMLIVIPLIAAASFVLSWWVTSHFSNDEPVRREPHIDV